MIDVPVILENIHALLLHDELRVAIKREPSRFYRPRPKPRKTNAPEWPRTRCRGISVLIRLS